MTDKKQLPQGIEAVRTKHADAWRVGFWQNGTPLPHAKYESKTAKKYARDVQLIKELQFCRALAEHAIKLIYERSPDGVSTAYDETDGTSLQIRSNYTALAITYGKLFSSGRARLEWAKVFEGEGAKFLKLHNWVITHRDEFVAHSGSETLEESATLAVFLPGEKGPFSYGKFIGYSSFYAGFAAWHFERILRLINAVQSWVETRAEGLIDHIQTKELTPEVAAQLKEKAVWTRVQKFPEPCPDIDD